MKKILITGAAGFIGSHLVEYLLKEGEPVNRLRLVLLENESTKFLPKENLEILRGDIRNKTFVKKIMEGVETVYHLAAITSTTLDKNTYKIYKEVNVDGTSNLLEACSLKKIQKFIFFSSVAVYGLPPWTGDIINWDETHLKTYSEVYGKSKLEAEEKVIDSHRKWGIPYAIIRPANVYGPRNFGQLYGLYKSIKNHQFFMIGNGKNKMHYVYVADLVGAVRKIQLSSRKSGEYIIASKEPTEFRNIVKFIAESIGEKPSNLYIPKIIGLVISYVLDTCGKIMGFKSPLFPDRVRVMTMNYYYDISKARKEFGYKPLVSFKEGAMETGKWYLENGYL